MRAIILLGLFVGTFSTSPSRAATVPTIATNAIISSRDNMTPPADHRPSFFNWQIGGSLRHQFDRPDEQTLDPSVATQLVSVTRFVPTKLEIEALSGHRSFATQSLRERTGNRLTVDVSNTIFGVGTTLSFDAAVAGHVYASPFVSLDYNRVDTARTVNVRSPMPFARNNGDTGLAGSAGATVSYVFGAHQGLRLTGYGAVSAGSRNQPFDDDSATVATRVVHALSKPAVNSVGVEIGVGTSYALTNDLRVDTAMVRASLSDGRATTSGTVALNLRF